MADSEKIIEKRLREFITSRGGIAYKFVSPGRKNVPDRLCVLPGPLYYFVEVKTTGKKLRPGQRREILRLKGMGCEVFVIDSYEKLEAFKVIVSMDREKKNG